MDASFGELPEHARQMVAGYNDKSRLRGPSLCLKKDFKAVGAWHCKVQDRAVWLLRLNQRNCLNAI